MAKILLISVLIATIAIPVRFAQARNPRGGLRRVVTSMVIYIFCWVGFLLFLFFRLGGGY